MFFLLFSSGFPSAVVLLTFGQGVPTGPICDPLVKEVPAVPSVVHPTVSIWVGPRQLSSHTYPHVPNVSHFHTQQRSHVFNIWDNDVLFCFFKICAPFWKFCHLQWMRMWSSLECEDLSTCRRGNWLPQLLHGGWLTGWNYSSASIW